MQYLVNLSKVSVCILNSNASDWTQLQYLSPYVIFGDIWSPFYISEGKTLINSTTQLRRAKGFSSKQRLYHWLRGSVFSKWVNQATKNCFIGCNIEWVSNKCDHSPAWLRSLCNKNVSVVVSFITWSHWFGKL